MAFQMINRIGARTFVYVDLKCVQIFRSTLKGKLIRAEHIMALTF